MAKQAGDIIIEGTIDDITFYIMDGKGYARKKSSLTSKRVKKDKRFKRTMQSAHRLARGSQLASKVYRSLPMDKQVYALFKELKRIAVLAIKEGKEEKEILEVLCRRIANSVTTSGIKKTRVRTKSRARIKAQKKNPFLFQVYGSKVKKAVPRAPKRRRWQMALLGTTYSKE